MFTFTCEKCGGQFYSKVDPSGWRHHVCNACSGKPYKDLPVAGTGATPQPSYQPKPVPTKVATPVAVAKKEFNLDDYVTDMLLVYNTLKIACDEQKMLIPTECLCSWTTSIMIQKGKI